MKKSDQRNPDSKNLKITKKHCKNNLKLSTEESNNKLIPQGTKNKKNQKS